MGGYNYTIFAYGQTGAGKTYTMQGPAAATGDLETSDEVCHDLCYITVQILPALTLPGAYSRTVSCMSKHT